jgi:hypothetical protein
MKSFVFFSVFFFFVSWVQGQSPYMLRGDQAYHTYDRLEILRKLDTSLNNSINNYNRKELVQALRQMKTGVGLTSKDIYDIRHILHDNIEFLNRDNSRNPETKLPEFFRDSSDIFAAESDSLFAREIFLRDPVWKYFYHTRANFLELETPDFKLYINPILHLSYHNQTGNDAVIFQNTRGVEVRSYIDNKVYLYTQLLENQRSFLDYVDRRAQRLKALPGQSFYKTYQSRVLNSVRGYDFFHTRAFVGFQATKSIQMEMGHGNHFIGNGVRSLLLGDLGPNYFYASILTRMWKFNYQNIFAELAPITPQSVSGDESFPKKFKTTHYLSFNPSENFEIGIFESVVFGRQSGFEWQYLNPVILYRAVEQSLGSPDNVLVGLNIKYNPIKYISLYGQLVLNEFRLNELLAGTGWWGNKYGIQYGGKYINAFGIDHLDLQYEFNTVRPYTYTHRGMLEETGYSIASYSHYHQPLAHPLGANFRETILLARYKPHNKVYLQGRFLYTVFGDDEGEENWGGDILKPYETRKQNFDNFTGQGIKNIIQAFHLDMSYEFRHNYWLDIQAMWRTTRSEETLSQHYLGGGIRVNISQLHYDY